MEETGTVEEHADINRSTKGNWEYVREMGHINNMSHSQESDKLESSLMTEECHY
jgi:hypothetical protein